MDPAKEMEKENGNGKTTVGILTIPLRDPRGKNPINRCWTDMHGDNYTLWDQKVRKPKKKLF